MLSHRTPIGRYALRFYVANARGATLITALMFMTTMAALAPFLMRTTTLEVAMSGNHVESAQAMYAAEAGVNRLVRKYRNEPSIFTDKQSLADMALPEAKPGSTNLTHQMAYWYTDFTYEGSTPPRYVDFVSNGGNVRSRGWARIASRLLYEPLKPFDYGLFADETMVLNGSGAIDSYNACVAPYDPDNPSENGHIGANATDAGSIVLNGNPSLVRGDAAVGVDGDPNDAIAGNGAITGSQTALEESKELVPRDAPTGGTYTTISISGGDEESLGSGSYETPLLRLSSTATLHITGDVTLHVNGRTNITGSARIIVHEGASLSLYVSGQAVIGGQGILNQNQLPSKLMVYGTENADSIDVVGDADFHGVVHAPASDVMVGGLGDFYGAVIAKTVTTSGSGGIHYDECLGDVIDTTVDPFWVAFWRLD